MPYAFLTSYNNQIGIFIAENYEAGRVLAWDSLKFMIPDPDPALFTIAPMTQADLDVWDGPPLSSMEPFEPWPGPSLDELRQELALYKGPSRPATQIEIEAMTAICNLQDEVYEAKAIIRAWMEITNGWKEYNPELYERTRAFLKPKPAQTHADGDE